MIGVSLASRPARWSLLTDKSFLPPDACVDLSWASTDQVMRLHQYNIFPNLTLLANADHFDGHGLTSGARPRSRRTA